MPDRRHQTGSGPAILVGSLLVLGLAQTASAQVALRDLSGFVSHSQPVPVAITVTPPAGTIAYGVEDAPPAGWVSVSDIDNGGTWDAINKKVKWGPYFTDQPVTLHYTLAAPIPVPGGTPCFAGVVSIDGHNQLVAGAVCLPATVPAVSDWGLVGVALALLVTGTLLLRRHRTPIVPSSNNSA